MKCVCPKCSSPLSVDLQDIQEKGKSNKCSDCGGSYWIQRESFILRAYAVKGERYCSSCGEGLGASTYCPGCGTLYPDYCVVHSKKPGKRAFEKKSFSLNLVSLPKVKNKPATTSQRLEPAKGARKAASSDLRRQLIMAGTAIAVIAGIVGGVLLYKQNSAENKFTKDFVVALYGLKSGTEHCMKKSEILGSGKGLSDKDLALLKSVKAEIATAVQVLSPPPKKFNDAYNQLQTLSGTYEKLHKLSTLSAPSAEVLDSASKLDAQFTKQAKELKGVLPPQLLAELQEKSARYNNLQFMLN